MKEDYVAPEAECMTAQTKDLITSSGDNKIQLPDVENPF